MRRVFFAIVFLLAAVPAFAQTVPPPINTLRWELPANDVDPLWGVSVNRFELCYDALPACVTVQEQSNRVPNPTTEQGGPGEPGMFVYLHPVPALVPKADHKVFVRACNVMRCGPDSQTLTFPVEVGMPQAPRLLRFVGPPRQP